MKLVVILTLHGGMHMAKNKAQSTDNVNPQALPHHIREFLTVSAMYLGVLMDRPQMDNFSWRD